VGTTPYDINRIRAEFPILRRTMRGKPLAYLDNGATALKPECVIAAELDYLSNIGANIHRGVYELSERATELFDDARAHVKRFIGCTDGELVFTKSSTEASNIAAFAYGGRFLAPGDEILVTEIEHHANLIPWQEVARRTGAVLRFVPLAEGGLVTVDAVCESLTDRTRIVAVTGMSNVTGFMPDIPAITEAAHRVQAIIVVDGAQLVSHYPVDVGALDCDMLTFSGHKMCGPTGVGCLYGKREILESMDPYLYGGDMIVRVQKDSATYKGVPEKFEAGTPNVAGVIGLSAAVTFLESIGMAAIAEHEEMLRRYAVDVLSEVPEVEIYGATASIAQSSGGIVSFNVGDIHPHDVGAILDGEGIAVRAGFHCAQPFMRHLGVSGTVRASFYLYNTTEEIDRLVVGLDRAIRTFA
jgi:cysteine desulfurase/selenocysteine lyase